ncbi:MULTISPECIES: MerR family transcriptional regulator [Staphylococcus]|nr:MULTISPECIES: MerR family transcriptional regulator [Staphylococcus]MBY6179370.1 MerR family transcriptional regulator [Staphylococcaceae bacterium DP2N0-1]MCH4381893.1 MerR family transcriptional regulator [Staphylococcus haemolyticus]MCH4388345.1 MerR family transcriptional regulator [Staphylococcus haemolyticus]MCH4403116.1 MerR family transcriptional regulator [Staphylococcus haemolyticus]MCH4476018.1 MerR family transcriptional regulator [Staphylococcus haemolyticus]
MQIDEVSKKLNISKSMIRYYEEKGLINISRNQNNYREFNQTVYTTLKLIKDLKRLNLSLEEIKYIVNLFNKPISKECNIQSTKYLDRIIKDYKRNINEQINILNRLEQVKELSQDMKFEENKTEILNMLAGVKEYD